MTDKIKYLKCFRCGNSFPARTVSSFCRPCQRLLPVEFEERFAYFSAVDRQWPELFNAILKLELEVSQHPNIAPERIAEIARAKDRASNEIANARAYLSLVDQYSQAALKCKSIPVGSDEYEAAATEFLQLRKKLSKRRRGRRGPLSDIKRWELRTIYNAITGPYPIEDVCQQYGIETPSPENPISARIVCQTLADAFGLDYEQCAKILHGMKDGIIAPLPPRQNSNSRNGHEK